MFKLLILYYVLAVIYLILRFLFGKKQLLTRFIILLFCPFISIGLIWALDRRQIEPNGTPFQASMDYLLRNKHQREIYFEEDMVDVIPLADALLLNEDQKKRQMLIRLLKDYSIDHLSILKKALENEDSETTHYAAAAIQEMKRKLETSLQTLEYEAGQNPDDLDILSAYSKALSEYIKSGLFEERMNMRYMYQYNDCLEKLIQLEPEAKLHHIAKIENELELKDYDSAKSDAKRFLKYFPDEEESYFSMMKVYYILNDRESFEKTINKLREFNSQTISSGTGEIEVLAQ
ncbi:hypothetical protein LC048_18850 [Mesobacillus subterraneus]|uniref:tetratricopeptide repeat protein n=1 Tax=Mesobacillus subterraneus TaxID=285983 RepID=UPI00273D9602|nr:hypothetical protein [Mesobacillus subterraneus]WLR54470.1 hypothetical protein LC048_18850 [Mesobacillus subterraneus]